MLTVQTTEKMHGADPVAPGMLLAQATQLLACQNVRAIKVGALGSVENVRAALRLRLETPAIPWVIDPVLGATAARQGVRLLDDRALAAMQQLIALATLVTPNAREAQVLTGIPVRTAEDATRAGRLLVSRGTRAALVKGGHLEEEDAVDLLTIGPRTHALRGPRLDVVVHGTGCTLASLIAGRLAARTGEVITDRTIVEAVRWAKRVLRSWIAKAATVGRGQAVMGP